MAHMLWQPIPFLGLYPVGIFSHELNDVFRLLVAALFMTEVGIFKNKELVKLTVGHSDKGLSSSSSYVRGWSSFLIWRISKLFLEGKKSKGKRMWKRGKCEGEWAQNINIQLLVRTQSIAGKIPKELFILIPEGGGWYWGSFGTRIKRNYPCIPFCKFWIFKYMKILPTQNSMWNKNKTKTIKVIWISVCLFLMQKLFEMW